MTKFIRTGEGVLVFAFNITLLVVPIVSNALTPAQAVKWAAIVNGIAVVSRTGLKAVSMLQRAPGVAPQQFNQGTPQDIQALADAVVRQIPGALKGTMSADQLVSTQSADIPDSERIVSDGEHSTRTKVAT